MRRLLYHPHVNRLLRTAVKPVAPFLPEGWLFPVTGTISVEVEPGTRIRLACNPTSYLAKVLFWGGARAFEYGQVRLFIDVARRAELFVDVGANIGYYTVLAAAVNPQLQVVSFEPSPPAFRYLQQNVALNGCRRCTPEQIALSDRSGHATFRFARNPKYPFVTDHLTSTGGLDPRQSARGDLVDTVEVRTETLDVYATSHLEARIDVLKLDTEATEHLVLAGATRVLQEHRPVVFCEVLPGKIERALSSAFRRHEYASFRIEGERLVPVTDLEHGPDLSNDHVMVPREGVQAFLDRARARLAS